MKRAPIKKVNAKRKASAWLLAYGSKARCSWMKGLGCLVCHAGPVEIAHVRSRGAGGGFADTVPLCRTHHVCQHSVGVVTFERLHRANLRLAAAQYESLWMSLHGEAE